MFWTSSRPESMVGAEPWDSASLGSRLIVKMISFDFQEQSINLVHLESLTTSDQ